jgi:hypothetical protein
MKKCTKCGGEKSLSDFGFHEKGKYQKRSACKSCLRLTSDEHRDKHLRNRFGISLEQYQSMLVGQDYRCAICGSKDSFGKSPHFVVDHDHSTGKIRSLLCNKCNVGIGMLGDDPKRLEDAAAYLRKHK